MPEYETSRHSSKFKRRCWVIYLHNAILIDYRSVKGHSLAIVRDRDARIYRYVRKTGWVICGLYPLVHLVAPRRGLRSIVDKVNRDIPRLWVTPCGFNETRARL